MTIYQSVRCFLRDGICKHEKKDAHIFLGSFNDFCLLFKIVIKPHIAIKLTNSHMADYQPCSQPINSSKDLKWQGVHASLGSFH